MRSSDIALTAIAPAIWGSTYLITTEVLPMLDPLSVSALRALPAGLVLLAITREALPREWIGRTFLLGVINFALFWVLLFVAAYRLPGGIAATMGSLQALIVIGLSRLWLGTEIRLLAVLTALAGAGGVAVMLAGSPSSLDAIGVASALGSTLSISCGVVLARKWQPPVSTLAFTGWQLLSGGLMLTLMAAVFAPPLPRLGNIEIAALAWLSLIGAALTAWLWFRGISRLEPSSASMLMMMSPITAVSLGWIFLGEALTEIQIVGGLVVLVSVWISQAAPFARSAGCAHGNGEVQIAAHSPSATRTAQTS